MKRQRKNLTLPAIREFRKAISGNDLGGFLVNQCEKAGAGSVRVKYRLKSKPFVVTIEARRLSV
jgi:hypothetical protein